MQGLMVVVCGEGFQQEIALCLVPRPAPARIYVQSQSSNSPRKPQLRNSNWAQVTPLLREAEVYAAHNRKREATYI
jgi:hypothetical protein